MIQPKILQKKIEEILTLCHRCNELIGEWGSEKCKKAENDLWNAITALDNEAVSDLGPNDCRCVPGRIIQLAVADNYARYIISKVNKKVVKVVHLPYMDAYRSQSVNEDGEIWRNVVEDNLDWNDSLKEYIKNQSKPENTAVVPVEQT